MEVFEKNRDTYNMKAFCILSFFALVACTLANRELCPHPDDAEIELINQFISVDAIDAYAVAMEMDLADYDITHERITCVSIVPEEDSWGPVGVAIGQNRLGGWSIKLIAALSQGLRTSINVYAPDTAQQEENEPEPEVKLAKTKFHRMLKH